ncbi:hypothetical protein [Acholeplasma palmae]|uniref:hypothetical protein n=1 Tax=Acholeplasma palmae TaxID=38986 RepID=UPI0005FA7C65|nr:hypothetical protein [Alteracholeplasma palmae]
MDTRKLDLRILIIQIFVSVFVIIQYALFIYNMNNNQDNFIFKLQNLCAMVSVVFLNYSYRLISKGSNKKAVILLIGTLIASILFIVAQFNY